MNLKVYTQGLLLLSLIMLYQACTQNSKVQESKPVQAKADVREVTADQKQNTAKSNDSETNGTRNSEAGTSSVLVQGTPEWIVDQYIHGTSVTPDLARHFGARLVLLKNTPSLGMVAAQETSLKVRARKFYEAGRRVAFQVGIGTQEQELQAYWIFQKIDDLWIWTDLIQESPYFPWMKARAQIEPSLSYMKGQLFVETQEPSMRLYQVIQRGMGDHDVLNEYLDVKRSSYKKMQTKLAAEDRYSALLHNDSVLNPGRWKLWQHTGVYSWMMSESIERVQIESKELILFYYASQPKLEQGLMYCGQVDECKQLQPDIQGYYYIEYEKDSENENLDWVHFRGPKSSK